MSTSPIPSSSSARSKKFVVPKVWKRPHSTIYGKNVEFGSSLYSDKIGELNGRKFNSELPWTMRQRNSGTSSSSAGTSSSSGAYSQGYLSNLLLVDPNDLSNLNYNQNHLSASSQPLSSFLSQKHYNSSNSSDNNNNCHSSNDNNYAYLLELTNPARNSKRNKRKQVKSMLNNDNSGSNKRIDFYDQYMDFNDDINNMKNSSLLYNEPLLTRKVLNDFLDFDYDLGLFVPNHYDSRADRSLIRRSTYSKDNNLDINSNYLYCPNTTLLSSSSSSMSSNNKLLSSPNYVHRNTTPTPNTNLTKLLPKHECQLMSSPYGQSTDGRKLSLGSINPHSYRPSLPQKTTTAHASDGEEFEFQDKSSPFYTDR